MKSTPVAADRIIDVTALLMLLGGIGIFAFARSALTSIAAGTREIPVGMSAVAVTDFHVAQSKMGIWLIGVGVLVGVYAAVRHAFRQKLIG